ncbi:MAG TPA: alpha/beta fold hydrolase, partial [Rhizomicrobium sp.]
ERFIASPFVAGDRLYKTGDLARYLPDGNIEFLGRNDDQVKIRGFRIELGEIEATLIEHPSVREAVVTARADSAGDKRLAAYYVSADEEVGAAALRAHLAAKLPDYMVPAAYVRLQTLPLTPNGKLDRRALPAPEGDAFARASYEPPQGEVEETLAAIWAELLSLEKISRHDNFFELGGHSLLAVRMINGAKALGLEMTLLDLFEMPVLHDLASGVATANFRIRGTVAIPVRRSGAKDPIFFVPHGLGDIHYVSNLARHINVDRPIYGLPWPSFQETPVLTMEALAARMVLMIQAIQPQGPYCLAGYSAGGILAYAIAQYFLSIDETVSFVGLIDVASPAMAWRLADELTPATNVRELSLDALVEEAHRLGELPEWVDAQCMQQAHHFRELIKQYQAPSLSLAIHQFRANKRTPDGLSSTLGWEAVLPTASINVVPIPGDHLSLMEDAVNRAQLGTSFSEALRATAASPCSYRAVFAPLVALHIAQRSQAPLFCVPGAGASITTFVALANALGDGRSIYGLQPRGMELADVPHGSVEAAARFNLQAIDQLTAAGPVHLLGHSYGGLVAFEMARQLVEFGREVASMTLVDSVLPTEESAAVLDVENHLILREFTEAHELAFSTALDVDEQTLASGKFEPFVVALHGALLRAKCVPARSTATMLLGPLAVFAAARRAAYRPGSLYQGSVRLILAKEPLRGASDHLAEQEAMVAAWRSHAAELDVCVVPGNHFSILRSPQVRTLAECWKGRLV